ncbi:MAG: hypothetical protein CAPSK01_002085 [Candidatus Accumulibacter vicinus]|uniref:Uncharacterized protein n=1 Tax=Candidatus Accumulibacter vicinus TaxID=2954382 RepID=A0A084Y0I8_9PROT|nr:MAG: hypothetical protein CAPSK01_002085 [Candidatus Accumulibacter vicinus]
MPAYASRKLNGHAHEMGGKEWRPEGQPEDVKGHDFVTSVAAPG